MYFNLLNEYIYYIPLIDSIYCFNCFNWHTFALKAISLCPNAAVLYGNRAAAYMKRGWDGDLYAALRDCHNAITIDSDYLKAHFRLARCLYELHWNKEAFDCLQVFKAKFPDHANTQSCEMLDRDIQQAIFSKTESSKKGSHSCNSGKSERITIQTTRSQSEAGSNRNDDTASSPLDTSASSSISFTPSFLSHQEREWRSLSYDYKSRFCGHCNTTTDIKEANFFGRFVSFKTLI